MRALVGVRDPARQLARVLASYEHLRLPDELDYATVSALSFEARQKLNKHRPETLGQASRISGITPAAISLLLIHLKKGRFKGFARVDAAPGVAPDATLEGSANGEASAAPKVA